MNTLSGPEYTAALTTLSLTPEQAATWLGIGRSTAYRYLKTGCEGPVVGYIRLALVVDSVRKEMVVSRNDIEIEDWIDSLTAALGIPETWKPGDKLTWCDESFVFSHYDPAYPRAMCVSDVDGRTVAINITSAAAVGVGS